MRVTAMKPLTSTVALLCICSILIGPSYSRESIDTPGVFEDGLDFSARNTSRQIAPTKTSRRNRLLSYLRKCHWNCKKQEPANQTSWLEESLDRIKQLNTTCLLLFTQPGGDDRYESVLTAGSSAHELKATNFRPGSETVLLIHGFRSHFVGGQRWALRLKDLIMDRMGSANVMFVDWSLFSRTINYLSAKANMKQVAEDTAAILENLQTAFGPSKVNLTDLHLVGHSLGAHVSGLIARLLSERGLLSGKVRQITALDPTDVYMENEPDQDKLTADDAHYVMAFHTDANLGTDMSLADRDIFFNGGDWQPTCWATARAFRKPGCSHRAATFYASTYMDRCMMVGYTCTDYKSFRHGECGFCRQSSRDCVTAGFEWQYAPGSATWASLVPEDRGDKHRSRPWLHLNESQRYFVDVGAYEPYCLFTYQLVLKVQLNQRAKLEPIKLDLWIANWNESVQVELKHQMGGQHAPLRVFAADDATETKLIEGPNVLTGLLKIDAESAPEVYARLPARLVRARLPSELMGVATAEVYANLMSHSSYQTRAANSGPLELVEWEAPPPPS